MTKLNKTQLEIVEFNKGIMQVSSCAGVGKTTVLVSRIEHLITHHNVKPENILMLTFSKKATEEMSERLEKLIGKQLIRDITIGTFHSFGYNILKREYTLMNNPLKAAFDFNNGLNDTYKRIYIEDAMKTMKLDPSDKRYDINGFLGQIGRAKNELIDVEKFYMKAMTTDEFTLAKIYELYEARKEHEKKIDFDDMLLLTYKLFTQYPEILKKYQQKYQYVLIDEAQDNNFAQDQIVKMIAKPHNNIMIVGDDDQSLYGFRGARPKLFIDFKNIYPETVSVKLEENYRSVPEILDVANRLIEKNTIRLDKKMIPVLKSKSDHNGFSHAILSDEDEEAKLVAQQILNHHNSGIKYKECAVLYRTNAQTRAIEDQFLQNEIPYVIYGGSSFYELKEVKDLICYLRLIVNNDDDAAFERVINTPSRFLGKEFMNSLKKIAKTKGISLYKALKWVQMKPYQHKNVMSFMNLIDSHTKQYNAGNMKNSNYIIASVIKDTKYDEYLQKNGSEEDNNRLENVDSLLKVTLKYSDAKYFVEFIERITSTKKQNIDAIQMMTIHKSKGLEFKKVCLIGVSDNLLPHRYAIESGDPNAIEEERKLAYVGITRAKEDICVTSINSFNNRNVAVSRFFEDMDLI